MKDILDVVIPCFGRPKQTFLTVEALLKANEDIRVILVHDGGMDKPDLSDLDTNRIIQLDLPHSGQPKALNTAFKLVKSEYTVIMHNDVVINDKGWVEKAVNFLKRNKEAGMVCASGTDRIFTSETDSYVRLTTSLNRDRIVKRNLKIFHLVRPEKDFTETWRTDSMVNVFKTGIKADERYGKDLIIGISFWIDILASGLKNYVMKFNDGRHLTSASYNTEAYKKITNNETEVKKQGEFIKLRLVELGVTQKRKMKK